MDIAILLVVILNLILSLATFVLEFREQKSYGEPQTAESHHEDLVAPPKYAEPPTETLRIVGDHPRPPFPAPMVDGETVKQWMIHLYNNDNIWVMFTDSFYVRVMSRPLVRPLFEGKDMADIKRKFLATLLIMCDKGVNERAAATLVELHMHLNMSVKVYDSVMEALEETLVQYRVPEATIAQFVPLIDYFRDEMAVA